MIIEPNSLLKQVFPGVAENMLAEIGQYARLRTYPIGTLLCTEGAHEDVFYIISSGKVEITKRFDQGEERVLRQSGPGDFFGEMALIADSPRNANVRTLEETTVLEIDKPLFVEMLRTSPVVALQMFRSTVDRLRANDQSAVQELGSQKRAIENAYAELQLQERRRSEFLTTLSHELRTPLTSASGFMQLIKNGNVSGPALNMAIDKIGAGLEKIVSLVNDLLFVQEMDLIEPMIKPVNLPDILTRLVEDIEDDAADNSLELVMDVPANLPQLKADPDGLERALRALIDNAIKFSPEGGEIRLGVAIEGGTLNIAIRDPGIGIEPDFLPRIFQRFERRESYGEYLFGGIGLGLPIAQHLIESFGGSITVQSEPGKGSTFTVHLPVIAGDASSQAA